MTMLKFPPNDEFMSFCRTEGFPNNYNDCLKATLQNDLGSSNPSIGDLMRAHFDRFQDEDYFSITNEAFRIIKSYGADAHVYLPGIGVINGLTAGNYLDSAGTTAATVDNPVGLVVDSGGINAIQATTANKPILRRGAVNYLLNSNSHSGSTITPATGLVVMATGLSDQDGNLTARQIRNTTTTEQHRLFTSLSTIGKKSYVVYVKNVDANFVQLSISGTVIAACCVNFNISSGSISSIRSSGAMPTGEIVNLGNGFFRCSVTPHVSETLSTNVQFYVLEADSLGVNPTTTGTEKSVIVGGAMVLDTIYVNSNYIQTTAAAASSATGNYHWAHDSTDVLTATFPAGYESATTINASTAGQSTLTAQNIVGAYNIGPSTDTYGRFVFKTITASELAIVQSYCNRLAGV